MITPTRGGPTDVRHRHQRDWIAMILIRSQSAVCVWRHEHRVRRPGPVAGLLVRWFPPLAAAADRRRRDRRAHHQRLDGPVRRRHRPDRGPGGHRGDGLSGWAPRRRGYRLVSAITATVLSAPPSRSATGWPRSVVLIDRRRPRRRSEGRPEARSDPEPARESRGPTLSVVCAARSTFAHIPCGDRRQVTSGSRARNGVAA